MNKRELKYFQTKLWNLHIEELEFKENYKKEAKEVIKKIKKTLTRKEHKFFRDEITKWIQQTGKIIFISGILGNKDKIRNKVWRVRHWKFSKNKSKIIKK